MELVEPREVIVYGSPAPKGSLKCVGRNGRHQLVEANAKTAPWRRLVKAAGISLVLDLGGPIDGALGVECVFTLTRPRTIKPGARPYPSVRSPGHGDVDKLGRTVLDGLEDARLFAVDDAQVCELRASKCYSDHAPDHALALPGAWVRVYPIGWGT